MVRIKQTILERDLMMTGIFLEPGKSIYSQSSNAYYRIIKYLGQGGNAIAFRVQCTDGPYRGIVFVLKVQYNLSTPTRRERFMHETAFLKEETHPAILRHYDDGEYCLPDGRTYPFIITNYCPQNLENLIQQGSISFSTKVLYACQLLSALQFLQNKSIIHRDIKPSNIFINGSDAILGDFGLIKVLNPSLEEEISDDDIQLINDTAFHRADGYAAMPFLYRTPELVAYANKKDILHIESDVFQLGLVFAKLFTGENPLVETTEIKAPIRLRHIGYITDTEDGGLVFNLIRGMLETDYRKRSKISDLLSSFTMLYEKVGR